MRVSPRSLVRTFAGTPVVVICLTSVLVSCDRSEALDHPPHSPATNATIVSLLPDDVYALPSIDLAAYGRLLQELHGTPVVVNLWASWCKPCREEVPHLVEAANEMGDVIQFLGVNMQDQRAAAAAFMREFSVPFPSVFDQDGAIHTHLGFVGLPDTIFYDTDGNIVATWTGPITKRALADRLSALVGSE